MREKVYCRIHLQTIRNSSEVKGEFMKKIFFAALLLMMLFGLTAYQSTTKSLGGTTTIKLKPGVKLEEITWKDDDLWYLTRPMRDNESAETHTFDQSTDFGFEGQVIIIEKNK